MRLTADWMLFVPDVTPHPTLEVMAFAIASSLESSLRRLYREVERN